MESEATKLKRYIKRQRNIRTISPKLRHMIFDRDKHTCQYCGIQANPEHYKYDTYRGVDYIRYEGGVVLEVDHYNPFYKGGNSDPKNLKTACFACNQAKKHKTFEEWEKTRTYVKTCQNTTPCAT